MAVTATPTAAQQASAQQQQKPPTAQQQSPLKAGQQQPPAPTAQKPPFRVDEVRAVPIDCAHSRIPTSAHFPIETCVRQEIKWLLTVEQAEELFRVVGDDKEDTEGDTNGDGEQALFAYGASLTMPDDLLRLHFDCRMIDG